VEASDRTLKVKLRTFAESGITWGAIGAIVGAILVLIPLLALKWIFVAAGAVLVGRILMEDFFPGKSLVRKVTGNAILALLVAGTLAGLWRIIPKPKEAPTLEETATLTAKKIIELMPLQSAPREPIEAPPLKKKATPLKAEEAFAVAVETRIFVPPGGEYGTSEWAGGLAPGGCSLKSVQAELFLRITNLQKERTLITAYTVEAMGVPLTRIKMNLYKPFLILERGALKPSNQISLPIQMPVPQGGIGSLVTFKLKDAYPAEAKPVLAEFLDPQLAGHYLEHKQMVRGWAYFQYPNQAIFPAKLVLNISDETGHTFSYPIPDTGSDENADAMSRTITLGPTVDLSACTMER
jgi:hypothetical protein